MANEKRLIDAFESICKKCDHYLVCEYVDDETAECSQYKAPTVDAVEVVHGRWWYNNPTDTLNEHLMCTACKCLFWKNIEEVVSYPYCPNCGAKMDGDGNGNL